MGKRAMRTCRLVFAVPVEANADDGRVYSLSHAPTGLVILADGAVRGRHIPGSATEPDHET